MISWEPLQERHVRGTCKRGYLWIRVGRDGKVTALYTMFGEAVKYVPETDEERIAREAAEKAAQIVELTERIAEMNTRLDEATAQLVALTG